jgi:hypothetical protein
MCRNIRVLHNFEPPTTRDEMRAASLQYVRKISGLNKPSVADETSFNQAIEEVAAATEKLLAALTARGSVRTREGEKEKAALKWKARELKFRAASETPRR